MHKYNQSSHLMIVQWLHTKTISAFIIIKHCHSNIKMSTCHRESKNTAIFISFLAETCQHGAKTKHQLR